MSFLKDIFLKKKSNTPSVKTAFFAKKGSFTEGVFMKKVNYLSELRSAEFIPHERWEVF